MLALTLLALLWGPGSTARADIIFSDFGPNNSYDPTDGWTFGSAGSSTLQDIAVSFRVGSQPVTLGEIDVAMGITNSPNTVNLEIVPSVNGVPGPDSQALESFQLTNKLPFFGGDGPPLMIDSVLHPLLAANTIYWLVATALQPTQAMWNDNLLPYTEPFAYRINDGPWAAVATEGSPVFAILGSPVPEPATLCLLVVGVLGLFAYKCRRMLVV